MYEKMTGSASVDIQTDVCVHGLKYPWLECANIYLSDNVFGSNTNGGLDAHQNLTTPHDDAQRGIWIRLNHSNRRLPGIRGTRSPVCCSAITTSKKLN